ncbi:hypothetical protein [Pseudooceanicola spongiae]|uniref:Uncharacterized protein n=1 Tax=Pseudooceanicola spongiae TaxID=2613965 RepID=A0A7L9WL29_9RHOB|nr:hypothetical protein [Pseudooceanicola spongiae]QOL81105.1 hypothetical protein F3W81_09960 [Pseudooceanicola spongiae]
MMSLALQAIKYKIWLQLLAVGLGVLLYLVEQDTAVLFAIASILLVIGILYLFLIGLRQGYVWFAILFAILCAFNFMLNVTGGLSIGRIFHFVDAVLSFVAICGIVIWFRERRKLEKSGDRFE